MSKSNLHETAILKLVFQNIAHANIGDLVGLRPSTIAGDFFIALYTTDPTDSDTGTEANYTGYARESIPRSAVGFTVSANSVINASVVSFPISSGVDNTITHFGIRTASSGGDLLRSGSIISPLLVSSGDTPKFNAGDMTSTEE